jgi:outer membrane protein assembly factor BamB
MLRKMLLFVSLIGLLASAAFAQDDVATGLNNPRQLFLADDGTLYIAEAGAGGEEEVTGPFGPAGAGLTAQISAVSADGEISVILPDLVSMDAGFGQIEGPMAVVVTEDSYWVLLGMGPAESPFEDSYVEALLQIDRESGDIVDWADLGTFEEANNPDGSQELVSNPADFAVADDGTIYIADASGNSLLTWTAADGLNVFVAWPGGDENAQAVPTSVAIGADGSIYVGFLSGFPFAAGSARIEQYSADGELLQTFEGLTLVTDVLVSDMGDLYAVEMASGFGDTGYIPESGRIIKVTADGAEAVAEGLNFPYGFTMDADGNFLVTVDSAFGAPDTGRVVRIAGM